MVKDHIQHLPAFARFLRHQSLCYETGCAGNYYAPFFFCLAGPGEQMMDRLHHLLKNIMRICHPCQPKWCLWHTGVYWPEGFCRGNPKAGGSRPFYPNIFQAGIFFREFSLIHSTKLTWQWKMDPLKMYFHACISYWIWEYSIAMLVYQSSIPHGNSLRQHIPLTTLQEEDPWSHADPWSRGGGGSGSEKPTWSMGPKTSGFLGDPP